MNERETMPPPPPIPPPPAEELELVEETGAPQTPPPRPPVGVFACAFTLLVAACADALEVAFPLAWVPVDIAVALLLLLIWGRRWEVAVVILPELIPGVSMFPTWTLLAVYLTTGQVLGGKGK